MKITKLGHCCLVIEVKGIRILTDPGAYTTSQTEVKNIDLILITHEHSDHLHIESLKQVLVNNPEAKIITNRGVAKKLDIENIQYELVENLQTKEFKEVLIEGFGLKHAELYPSVVPVDNTGYFINGEFFYPGDAFTNPNKKVKILALPVAGTWLKISESINYTKEVMPEYCFPVHDGILKHLGSAHSLPEKELTAIGINFLVLKENEEREFK